MRTLVRVSPVVIFAAMAVGCAQSSLPEPDVARPRPSADSPPGPAAPDTAPTPFTAEQIRAASGEGRTIIMLEETPGKPPGKHRMRFLAVDDERATIASDVLGDDGKPIGEPVTRTATWHELQQHGAYPKNATTITEAVAEIPMGSYPCKRYIVIERAPEGEKRTIACFANDLPGPPVELSVEIGGALVRSLTMLSNDRGL